MKRGPGFPLGGMGERKEGDSGLEEARTQTHDSAEWEEGSREGILGVLGWTLRARALRWGRGWLRLPWSPRRPNPSTTQGHCLFPHGPALQTRGLPTWPGGLGCGWDPQRQNLGLWEQVPPGAGCGMKAT